MKDDTRRRALVTPLEAIGGALRHREELVALNFRVPFKFRQRMKLAATARGVSMTHLLTTAIEEHLGQEGATSPVQFGHEIDDARLVDEILNALKK